MAQQMFSIVGLVQAVRPTDCISLLSPALRADDMSLKGNVFVCIMRPGLCVHGILVSTRLLASTRLEGERLEQASNEFDFHMFDDM